MIRQWCVDLQTIECPLNKLAYGGQPIFLLSKYFSLSDIDIDDLEKLSVHEYLLNWVSSNSRTCKY